MKKLLTVFLTVLMLVSMTACSNGNEVPEVEVSSTKTADVVIVGAGGAGLAAAIEAVDNGA